MACRKNLIPVQIQFIVGVPDSLNTEGIDEQYVQVPVDGESQILINVPNFIPATVALFLDGTILPKDVTDGRISYGFPPTNNFLLLNIYNGDVGVQNGQLYVIHGWFTQDLV